MELQNVLCDKLCNEPNLRGIICASLQVGIFICSLFLYLVVVGLVAYVQWNFIMDNKVRLDLA